MWDLKVGNSLKILSEMEEGCVDCVVTSPPYWNLRDYHGEGDTWPEITYSPYPGGASITIPEQTAQLGSEDDPDAYIGHLLVIFREVFRVLSNEGSFYLNIGDTYLKSPCKGLPPKTLMSIPSRIKLALQADGWVLRNDIIWHKTRVLPSGAKDRFTNDHEYMFFFTKTNRDYFFDGVAVREPLKSSEFGKWRMRSGHKRKGGSVLENNEAKSAINDNSNIYRRYSVGDPEKGRNKRTVWSLCTSNFGGLHFATYPTWLVEPCIEASTSEAGKCPECGRQWRRQPDDDMLFEPACGHDLDPIPCVVLDPFAGAATTLVSAEGLRRDSIGIEISPEYAKIAEDRLAESSRENYFPWEDSYVPEQAVGDVGAMDFTDMFGDRE